MLTQHFCVIHREGTGAAAALQDFQTCRCLKISSITPERRVRPPVCVISQAKNHFCKKCKDLFDFSERVLGERPAQRGVRTLRARRKLLAESRERRADLEGAEDKEEGPGVALQAAAEIWEGPGERQTQNKKEEVQI